MRGAFIRMESYALNAVARTDTFGLYKPGFSSANVNRSGTPGNFTYSFFGQGDQPIRIEAAFEAWHAPYYPRAGRLGDVR